MHVALWLCLLAVETYLLLAVAAGFAFAIGRASWLPVGTQSTFVGLSLLLGFPPA